MVKQNFPGGLSADETLEERRSEIEKGLRKSWNTQVTVVGSYLAGMGLASQLNPEVPPEFVYKEPVVDTTKQYVSTIPNEARFSHARQVQIAQKKISEADERKQEQKRVEQQATHDTVENANRASTTATGVLTTIGGLGVLAAIRKEEEENQRHQRQR